MTLIDKESATAFTSPAINTNFAYGPVLVCAYFIVSSVFGIILNDTLISDILVAPLYFIVPTGLGLFVLYITGFWQNGLYLNRAQLVIFSFLFGAVLLTLVFTVREYYGFWRIPAKFLYWSAAIVSMLGFLKSKNLFQWKDRMREHGLIFVSAIPIVFSTYLINYYFFSDYPLTDIFQECHFMKGATEFSKFDILNRSTADSYIPIIQVLNGLLNLVYGYNLLRAQWIFPVLAAIFNMICIYTVVTALVADKSTRWIAFLLAATLLAGMHLTNGNMARTGSLVLLSVLVNCARHNPGWTKASLLLFLMIGAVFLGHILIKSELFYLVLLLTFIPACLYLARRMNPLNAAMLFASVLGFILTSVHRSPIIFVPAIVGVFVLLYLVYYMPLLRETDHKRVAFVYAAPVLLVLTAAFGSLIVVRSLIDQTILGSFIFADFYNLIVKTLIQQDMNLGGEVALGAGAKLAALELGRRLTPFLLLLLSVGFCVYWSLQFRRCRIRQSGAAISFQPPPDKEMLAEMLWLWPTFAILVFIILTGIPFAYRVGFLPVLLGSVIIARFLRYFYLRYAFARAGKKLIVVMAAGLIGYTLIGGIIVHRSAVFGGALNHDYLEWFLPVSLLLYAVVAVLFLFICLSHFRNPVAAGLAVALIITALYTDQQLIRTKFLNFSYGQETPSDATAITHYTMEGIELAQRLRSLPRDSVLISDPYTVSILRALTGLNAPFNYSNLDTMHPKYRLLLKAILNQVLPHKDIANKNSLFCTNLMKMLNLGSAELNYAYHHGLAREWNQSMRAFAAGITSDAGISRTKDGLARTIDGQAWVKEAFFGPDEDHWTIAVIVGQKTLAWAAQTPAKKVGYYPMNSQLEPKLVKHLEENYEILFNIKNNIIAFKVNCKIEKSDPKGDDY